MTFCKLRVDFNNVNKPVSGLPKCSSASATYNIKAFEALLRKVIYEFMQQLEDSSKVVIQTLTRSWTICLPD